MKEDPFDPLASEGPCPKCGTKIVTYHPFVGLLPQDVDGDNPGTHSGLVCWLRRENGALKASGARLVGLWDGDDMEENHDGREMRKAMEALRVLCGIAPPVRSR